MSSSKKQTPLEREQQKRVAWVIDEVSAQRMTREEGLRHLDIAFPYVVENDAAGPSIVFTYGDEYKPAVRFKLEATPEEIHFWTTKLNEAYWRGRE